MVRYDKAGCTRRHSSEPTIFSVDTQQCDRGSLFLTAFKSKSWSFTLVFDLPGSYRRQIFQCSGKIYSRRPKCSFLGNPSLWLCCQSYFVLKSSANYYMQQKKKEIFTTSMCAVCFSSGFDFPTKWCNTTQKNLNRGGLSELPVPDHDCVTVRPWHTFN